MEVPQQAASDTALTELVALRVMSTAIRCREIGGGAVTYRRSEPLVIPGQRLSVSVRRRWKFRRTEMLGGELVHAGFSLRALWVVGLALASRGPDGLVDPAERDERMREAVLHADEGDSIGAQWLLHDVLEDEPGSLLAHATLARAFADLCHHELALAHATAAIRLGMGALSGEGALPLDPRRPLERALVTTLLVRSRLLVARGQAGSALADLNRAETWDPTDALGARALRRDLEERVAAGLVPLAPLAEAET
jgi:hypothetical protein